VANLNNSYYDIELTDSNGNLLIYLNGVVSIAATTNKLFEKSNISSVLEKSVKIVELN
jgi:hypothetical protein